MAYYKVRIEIWCDWDPGNSDLEEIIREAVRREDAICTLQQVVTVVERPHDVGDDKAMSFFGGEEGDAELSQG